MHPRGTLRLQHTGTASCKVAGVHHTLQSLPARLRRCACTPPLSPWGMGRRMHRWLRRLQGALTAQTAPLLASPRLAEDQWPLSLSQVQCRRQAMCTHDALAHSLARGRAYACHDSRLLVALCARASYRQYGAAKRCAAGLRAGVRHADAVGLLRKPTLLVSSRTSCAIRSTACATLYSRSRAARRASTMRHIPALSRPGTRFATLCSICKPATTLRATRKYRY